MLVLTRREGEEIVMVDQVGKEVARVRVVKTRSDRVRLAVEAPLTLGVHRAEVYEAIKMEQRLRAGAGPDGPVEERAAVA